jgi:hypothetical protein
MRRFIARARKPRASLEYLRDIRAPTPRGDGVTLELSGDTEPLDDEDVQMLQQTARNRFVRAPATDDPSFWLRPLLETSKWPRYTYAL